MRKVIAALLLPFFISFNSSIAAQNAENSTEILTIESRLKEMNVPALGLVVLKNGRVSRAEVYGELYEGKPAPEDAIFNVASLTKPIVTMLTLKLVENGDWTLDEPLHPYWVDPDVKEYRYSKILTTRHILTHQSGFPNWRWENEDNKLAFKFEPGKGYGYSGEGFEYLQNALESKFQKPLEKLADSLIFQPLDMEHSWFYWNDSVEEEKFAKWHDSEGNNSYSVVKDKSASAADDLLITIGDYGKFAEYVLEKIAEEKVLYKEMVTRGNGVENQTVIGLGWELLPDLKNEEYAVLHTGGDRGVNTLIMLLPETGEGVIIFTNGDNGNQLFFELINDHLSLGEQITGAAQ
ncbi:serine hydrolase [Gramella sp. KN1008]|uniref:serine hydrolase domain-containing protein n=1 Tax=Gramella sp. KN1008 TaxID=2529298 RepID=UPI00103EC036|nr:serine hydrolase domain-containing protein [Gramella sp. KN1008]TBW29994.1 class A beta-lactamase-related serine hydrolase [Gramella sp. KN1008]